MKWLISLILWAIALAAIAVGVGFLLPRTLDVSKEIVIERPRATVFTLVNDLETFNDWSPYAEADPEAKYTFTGPAFGPGQKSCWVSKKLGDGCQEIMSAKPFERVDLNIDFKGTGTAATSYTLSAVEGGTKVQWSFKSDLGINPIARYLGLFIGPATSNDFQKGLAQLKKLAETLPSADFEGLDIALVDVASKPMLYVEGETSQAPQDRASAIAQSLAQLDTVLNLNNLTRDGAPVIVRTKWEAERFGFQIGIPYAGTTPSVLIAIKAGQTPSGRAARAIAKGDPALLPQVYRQLEAYVAAHRLTSAGAPWEFLVGTEPAADPAAAPVQVVETYLPVK